MSTPTIYLLHGDDEMGITTYVQGMQDKMGDPTTAGMNTTRLEGRGFSLGDLERAASAMPFLASRRLVIIVRPISQLRSQPDRKKFTDLLERLPPSTAVVLIEEPLKDDHWLLKWAHKTGERVLVKLIALPKGAALAQWIRAQARARGGDFTPEAATHLANLVADDNRMASSEIDKLLAFVNYKRPVDLDDVDQLTPNMQTGDVFQMVDAIGSRQGKVAVKMLHQQLMDRDPLSLLGMITRQFRLLLQAKEMLNHNATSNEIAHALKVHEFVARKLTNQCRNFDLPILEGIYRKLAEVDENIKTGKMEAETALDTLVVGLTGT